MTCPACARANADPASGELMAGCVECDARDLSRSLEHARARTLGKMTPDYMARLRAVFGDGWEAGHRMVKAWAKKEIEA